MKLSKNEIYVCGNLTLKKTYTIIALDIIFQLLNFLLFGLEILFLLVEFNIPVIILIIQKETYKIYTYILDSF